MFKYLVGEAIINNKVNANKSQNFYPYVYMDIIHTAARISFDFEMYILILLATKITMQELIPKI